MAPRIRADGLPGRALHVGLKTCDAVGMATDSEHRTLDRRMTVRVRMARLNVRNAAKLGIILVDRIIEISEMPMYPGDHFDAGEFLKKVPGWQSRGVTVDREGPAPHTATLDERMQTRVIAGRVAVKAAAKLGITPEPGVIEIAEMSMHSGDHFDASEVLKARPGAYADRASRDRTSVMSVRRPKLSWRTRRRIAFMVLRGELTVFSDSLTQFAPDARGGRLVLGFVDADERDSADLVSG